MTKTKKTTTNNEQVMGVNTLVRHTKLSGLGIGCISKVHPKHFTVNWGLDDSAKCVQSAVIAVDVSKCKTVSFHKFRSRIMMADPKTENLNDVIVGNVVKHFVGIGWTDQRVVTEQDLKTIPRVIQ